MIHVTEWWLSYIEGSLIDGGIAFAIAWLFWRCFRCSLAPGAGWWLFALVLVKCVVPLHFVLPEVPVMGAEPISQVAPFEHRAPFQETAAPEVTPLPTAARVPWGSVWISLYIAGVAFGICRVGFQFVRTSRIVTRAREMTLSGSVGLPPGVVVRATAELESPAAWNFGSPTVILPERMIAELSPSELRWAVAHEIAHLSRNDGKALLACRILRAFLFYHPVVWLAIRAMEMLAEQECDRIAARNSHQNVVTSARHLLAIATQVSLPSAGAEILAPGLSAAGRSIRERLKALVESASSSPLGVGGFVALIVAITVIVPSFRRGASAADLKQRVAQLEQKLATKSELEEQIESNVALARARRAQDHARIGHARARELEIGYQAAKKITAPDAAIAAMEILTESFPRSNRAGCCALYIARLLPSGALRDQWLTQCTNTWSDCYFLDGTSVGALAYKLKADAFSAQGDSAAAAALHKRIAELYPGATNFGGTPLL